MSKKDFTDRPNPAVVPAMQFFSVVPEVEEKMEEPTQKKVVQPGKPKPVKKKETGSDATQERKTKRVNLLMQPSVVEDLQKIATMRRTSLNDLVNSVMREYSKEEEMLLQRYKNVFGE